MMSEDAAESRAGRGARHLSRASLVALILGLGGVTALVAWQGAAVIVETLAQAGWKLLLLVPVFAVPLVFAALSWRWLFARSQEPRVAASVYGTWIGFAVNWLLPVAQIGGELVKARLAHRRGADGAASLAAAVADKTVQTLTQAVYTLVGVALLVATYSAGSAAVIVGSLLVAMLLGLGAFGFYRAQQRGMFGWLAAVATRMRRRSAPTTWHESAAATDEAIRATYVRRRRFAVAFGLSLAHRFALALEVWLLLTWLGFDATLAHAVLLESLGQAVRAAAFLVPGGLFAQESGYLVLGAAIGLSAPVALSVSLGKRARELLVGLPALAVWQVEEARYALRRPVHAGPADGSADTMATNPAPPGSPADVENRTE